jgi:SPP1 gp7 family putative phage head morphogenesis protein
MSIFSRAITQLRAATKNFTVGATMSAQSRRLSKDSIIINKVNVRPIYRKSADIQLWRNAIQQAENIYQQRHSLYDLYHDLFSDGFLARTVKKRIEAITNQEIRFKNKGKENEDIEKIIRSTAFTELLEEIINAKIFGHSLLELSWALPNGSDISITTLIPRRHVKPRFGIVTKEYWDLGGTSYIDNPNVVEVGKQEDLGELMAAAQYVIYKRGAFGDWAEYAEIFGTPFRWATYHNEQSRTMLEEALEKAGSAGYVVAPEDAKLQFLSNSGHTGNDTYKSLKDACNEEIAITILGNTMTTTEAKHSGFAQSYTHAATQEEVHLADRKFVLSILNEKLTPYLTRLGYKTKNGLFSFDDEDKTPLISRVDIDLKVATQVPVGDGYWYEKYGIPKPTPEEVQTINDRRDVAAQRLTTETNNNTDPKKPEKKKTKLKTRLANLNNFSQLALKSDCCHTTLSDNDLFDVAFKKIPDNIQGEFITAIWDEIDLEIHKKALWSEIFNRLKNQAEAGYGERFTDKNQDITKSITENIAEFTSHKLHTMTEALKKAKERADGSVQVFEDKANILMVRHTERYLEVEEQAAYMLSHSAERWHEYQKATDLYPSIEYQTVGDSLVRDSHAAMDGLIRPITDPIWEKWFPPNGWNCRCITLQSDDEPRDGADSSGAKDPDKGFAHNPGITGKLWDDQHPYFNVSKKVGETLNKEAKNYTQ